MKILLIPFLLLALLVGSLALRQNEPNLEPNLGIAVPVTVAVYEDSLQASISSSASALTLVRGTDKRGNNLSARVSAVIDEGSSSEEFMIVTCAATACTINSRGLDPINPTTEVTALKFAHRRGASFKITDYPQLAILSRIINGDERFPNHVGLSQAFVSATASTTDFATKAYVDSVGAGGFTAANVAASKGLYVLGTSPETVGILISSTSSALTVNTGVLDSELRLKAGYGLTIDTGGDGSLRVNTSTAWTFGSDFKVSDKVATTTIGLWVGSAATTTYVDLLGGDLYVQNDAEIDGTLYVPTLNLNGTSYTKISTVASSTIARIGTTATSLTTLQTYIITAGPPAGTIYSFNAGYTKTGTAGGGDMAVLFNGVSIFISSACSTATGSGTFGSAYVNVIFGSIAGTNQEVGVNGMCSGGVVTIPGSMATTTIKTAEAHNVDFQGKATSGDTMTLDNLSIIKY